ncbi:MAG: riboflavin biosynthesis protein RibF [Clostridia bacterium]|nr:riboflavin biosynthesis protein RibF [Clostridia bacterium]
MDILKYKTKRIIPSVLCLGYFDALHKGHIKIINTAKNYAKKINAETEVFVFTGGKNNTPDLFTFEERLIKFKILGVDAVIYQELNKEFMAKSKEEFLKELFSYYNVKAIVVGKDYTFGKNAEGNVEFLKEYLNNIGVSLLVCDDILDGLREKISTKNIKSLILKGDVLNANNLLGSNYFISGTVKKGKGLGQTIGFPTANVEVQNDKLLVKKGVYVTCTIINGKLYSSITNVGNQPTVNGKNELIETYIHNFNGDLYGKKITVYFVERIRDIFKFSDLNELKSQLKKDLGYIYD